MNEISTGTLNDSFCNLVTPSTLNIELFGCTSSKLKIALIAVFLNIFILFLSLFLILVITIDLIELTNVRRILVPNKNNPFDLKVRKNKIFCPLLWSFAKTLAVFANGLIPLGCTSDICEGYNTAQYRLEQWTSKPFIGEEWKSQDNVIHSKNLGQTLYGIGGRKRSNGQPSEFYLLAGRVVIFFRLWSYKFSNSSCWRHCLSFFREDMDGRQYGHTLSAGTSQTRSYSSPSLMDDPFTSRMNSGAPSFYRSSSLESIQKNRRLRQLALQSTTKVRYKISSRTLRTIPLIIINWILVGVLGSINRDNRSLRLTFSVRDNEEL